MNSRQLIADTLSGMPVPRYPWGPHAVHYTASLSGVTLREYTTDPNVLADCVTRYYERFQPDAVWISADTWVTAEAMGVEVGFPAEDQPATRMGGPLIRDVKDIDAIPPCDTGSSGRIPQMLESLRIVKERLGEEVFIVGCFDQSPFSLACALAGLEEVMVWTVKDHPFIDALLERCIEYATAYGIAMAKEGADMLSTGDSPAGLIGPDHYREIALPAEKRVFQAIKRESNTPISLHICGMVQHILGDMTQSDCDVIEIDHETDLGAACRIVPEHITLWGNLDPVGLLYSGIPEEIERAAQHALDTVLEHNRRRFVLSSGCTIPPGTPEENLRALMADTDREII